MRDHRIRTMLLAGIIALGTATAGCPTAEPVKECEPDTNEPCFDGYTCDPATLMCLRSCEEDADCLASQACDLSDSSIGGICRGEERPGDTDAGGDSGGGDS